MKTRVCALCRKRKSIELFAKNKAKKSGYNSSCMPCQKSYKDGHYRANKEVYYRKSRAYIKRVGAWLTSLKTGKPCADCGQVFPPVCMDFDHIQGRKAFNISSSARRGGRKAILKEIAKCELVCANCHRVRTLERRTKSSHSVNG